MKSDNNKKVMIERLRELRYLDTPKDTNFIALFLSSDANYEPHLWVTISSLIDNARSDKSYYIYVLDGGINNKQAFYELVKRDEHFHIEFIDMKDQFIFVYENRHISKAAYYRLSVFKLFKNFSRVIYIDADSYVLGDIAELYDLPIGEKSVAGAKDSITYEIPWREKYISYPPYSGKAVDYFRKYLKFSDEKLSNYFSSGVLLFNLEKIDTEKKHKELENLLKREFYCHDQDILNLLFTKEETFNLPREWNYFNSAPILKGEDFYIDEERKNYLGSKVTPKIVSYVLKPWEKEHMTSPYADIYWKKIEESPYYEEVKKISEKSSKLERFKKLSLAQKIKFLTSEEAFKKYREFVKNVLK